MVAPPRFAAAAVVALCAGLAAADVRVRAVHAANEAGEVAVELGGSAFRGSLQPGGATDWVSLPEHGITISGSVPGAAGVATNVSAAAGGALTAFIYSSLGVPGSPLAVFASWTPSTNNVTQLVDRAAVRVLDFTGKGSRLFGISSFCHACLMDDLAKLPTPWNVIDVEHSYDVQIRGASGNATLAAATLAPREHGLYTWAILPDTGAGAAARAAPALGDEPSGVVARGGGAVLLSLVDVAGNDVAVPLLTAFGVLFAVGVVLRVSTYVVDRVKAGREGAAGRAAPWETGLYGRAATTPADDFARGTGTTPVPSSLPKLAAPAGRVHSLDTVRGACLVVMIFVNYGGGGYWFFDHSRWNGLTVADLVFPLFVWIMGTSMTLSFAKFSRRAQSDAASAGDADAARRATLHLALKVARRGATLFLLGLLLNNGYELRDWRIPGVLQYFAVAFLFCALLNLLVPQWRGGRLVAAWRSDAAGDAPFAPAAGSPSRSLGLAGANAPLMHAAGEPGGGPDSGAQRLLSTAAAALADVVPYWPAWLASLVFPAAYLALEFGLPVRGCPTGYIGPGGIGDGGRHPDCTGGAHLAIDKAVFGERHIYQDPTCRSLYRTGAYDPEGLLGSLNCVFICWLGCQAGRVLHHHKTTRARVVRWLLWGLLVGGAGTALCGFTRDGGAIPLNKNLWSTSFILVMAGIGFWALAGAYLLVDHMQWWAGAPFRAVGCNSILIYMGHEILNPYFPFSFTNGDPPSHANLLLSNLVGVCCWVAIAHYLAHKRFFFKI